MPFRCREIYEFPPASPHGEVEIHTNPNGKCFSKMVLKKDPLPPCENFDLSKILESGLPLEKVSTIIKSPRSIPLELVEDSNTNPTTEKE